jgi:hypothetical protein
MRRLRTKDGPFDRGQKSRAVSPRDRLGSDLWLWKNPVEREISVSEGCVVELRSGSRKLSRVLSYRNYVRDLPYLKQTQRIPLFRFLRGDHNQRRFLEVLISPFLVSKNNTLLGNNPID